MDDQLHPSAETKLPSEGERPDPGRVVEWFKADGAPFGAAGKRSDQRPDPSGQAPEDAEGSVSSTVRKARALAAAAEKTLADASNAKPGQIQAELDRIAVSLAKLKRERDVVEVALATLKRRQRRQVS